MDHNLRSSGVFFTYTEQVTFPETLYLLFGLFQFSFLLLDLVHKALPHLFLSTLDVLHVFLSSKFVRLLQTVRLLVSATITESHVFQFGPSVQLVVHSVSLVNQVLHVSAENRIKDMIQHKVNWWLHTCKFPNYRTIYLKTKKFRYKTFSAFSRFDTVYLALTFAFL